MITAKVIYGLLNASTAVKAIISDRFYPIIAPQGATVPLITYKTTQRLPSHTKSSTSMLDTYQLTINMFHKDYTVLCTLCEAVRTAMDGFSGTTNSVAVQHLVYESGTEGYIEDGNYFYIEENYTMRIQRNGL